MEIKSYLDIKKDKDYKRNYESYLLSFKGDENRIIYQRNILNTKLEVLGYYFSKINDISKEILLDSKNNEENLYYFLDNSPLTIFEEKQIYSKVVCSYFSDIEKIKFYLTKMLKNADSWAISDSVKLKKINKIDTNKYLYDLIPYFISYLDKSNEISNFDIYVRTGLNLLFPKLKELFLNNKNYITSYIIGDVFQTISTSFPSSYYLGMMVARLLSYFYIYDKELVINLLKERRFNKFITNKTISKIKDSFRVSKDDKENLNQYRLK